MAKDAQEWADRMAANGVFSHRPRTGPDARPYGENLASANGQGGGTTAVDRWVNEEKAFFDPVTSKCTSGNVCGHYTQVISQLSREVGCGNSMAADGSVYTVCNYDPGGNLVRSGSYADLYPNQRSLPGGAVFQNLNRELELSLMFNDCLRTRAAAIAASSGAQAQSDLAAECGFTKVRSYDSGSGLMGYTGTIDDAGAQAMGQYFRGVIMGVSGAVVVQGTNPLRAVLVTGEN